MQINVPYRYSDYATSFISNGEELSYVYNPDTNIFNVEPNTIVEIMPFATFNPKIEYFINFKVNLPSLYNSENFERLLFLKRSAGIFLPLGEINYTYEYTKAFSYSNYLKNISAFAYNKNLVVQLLTEGNVYIPKNDEALVVVSSYPILGTYRHSGYRNFVNRQNNFFIKGGRQFDGVITPCEECIQEELLKNYDLIKSLPRS